MYTCPSGQSFVDHLRVVNCGDQPVPIVLYIEHDKAIHIIRVRETLAQLNKISPSG